jgi:hypothetical protein
MRKASYVKGEYKGACTSIAFLEKDGKVEEFQKEIGCRTTYTDNQRYSKFFVNGIRAWAFRLP